MSTKPNKKFQPPRKPSDEEARQQELDSFAILDTPADQTLEDLIQIAAQICEVPMAAISLVDRDRQWFKSKVGFDMAESSRDVSFCGHTILEKK